MDKSAHLDTISIAAFDGHTHDKVRSKTLTNAHIIGSGSDSRRKDIIFRKFSSEALFVSHKYMLREGFYRLSSTFETSIQDAIVQQVSHIETDLRLLRDENIILESERNPRFREMLAQEIDRIGEELRTIRGELGWLIQEGEGI